MVKNQRGIVKRVTEDGRAEVKRMTDTFNLPKNQVKNMTSIITQPETRKLWSDSLWVDSDKLASDVQYLVNQHLKHGMSLDDLDELLNKHANPKQFKPGQSIADRIEQIKFNMRRIVWSESAHLVDEVNMTTYSMQGIKWVNWVTEPSACEKCLGIAEGGPYLLKDAPSIPDDTHPNCRCSKIPRTIPEPDLWPAMLAMKDFKSLAENSDDLTDEKKQTTTDKNSGYVGTSNSFNTNDTYRGGTSNELSDANKKRLAFLRK